MTFTMINLVLRRDNVVTIFKNKLLIKMSKMKEIGIAIMNHNKDSISRRKSIVNNIIHAKHHNNIEQTIM